MHACVRGAEVRGRPEPHSEAHSKLGAAQRRRYQHVRLRHRRQLGWQRRRSGDHTCCKLQCSRLLMPRHCCSRCGAGAVQKQVAAVLPQTPCTAACLATNPAHSCPISAFLPCPTPSAAPAHRPPPSAAATHRKVLWRHSALGQVDVALLLVHAQHHDRLLPPHLDQLLHRADAPPRQLRQQDHALYVAVLQQRHIGAHLSDGAHLQQRGFSVIGCRRRPFKVAGPAAAERRVPQARR